MATTMSTNVTIPPPEELARQLDEAKQKIASQKSKKRKRSNNEDNAPNREKLTKEKKKTNKKKKKQKKKTNQVRARDDLYDFDESNLEMPTMFDFRQRSGPRHWNYDLTPLKATSTVATKSETPIIAPQPKVPAADDDSKRIVYSAVISKSKPASPNKSSKPSNSGKKKEKVKTDKPKPTTPLPKILSIPVEVREEIYRHLLVSPNPIPVRAGWTRIYERERPCLETAIIKTCKTMFIEATKVLYSENTFLYRLRDPGNFIADIERLAEDDDMSEYGSDDDRAEFGARSTRRSRKKMPASDEGGVINIPKYGALFRRLIVEAEHNRYSEQTQQHMAKAIRVFTSQAAQPGENAKAFITKGVARATNIHTLTVRVAPMRNGEGSFTFVDFFNIRSPVLKAMTSVSCQFLRVELLGRYLNRGLCGRRVRMSMDMRYRRLDRRANRGTNSALDDMWRNDRQILETRERKIQESYRALNGLEDTIQKWCDSHAEPEEAEEDWFAFISDDGWDDGLVEVWDPLSEN